MDKLHNLIIFPKVNAGPEIRNGRRGRLSIEEKKYVEMLLAVFRCGAELPRVTLQLSLEIFYENLRHYAEVEKHEKEVKRDMETLEGMVEGREEE